MTKPVIIAFTGRKGHGKDSAAVMLKDIFPKENPRIAYFAFASILKDIVQRSLDLSLDDIEHIKHNDNIKIANGKNFRQYINDLGDAIKSYFGFNIWAEKTIQRIQDTNKDLELDLILITDLRYPIEYTYLKKFSEDEGIDFYTIKVINLNQVINKEEEHESEYLVDEIPADFTIEASTLEELREKLKEIINAI